MKQRYRVVVVHGDLKPFWGNTKAAQNAGAVVLDSAQSHAIVAEFGSEGDWRGNGSSRRRGVEGAIAAAETLAAELNAA